jgi:exodeoxyribonuclease VII large subunit
LCRAIAEALEAQFNPVRVVGEISGFSRASSGHCYFSLKDEGGQLRCAMFRKAATGLDFSPKDGELVEVYARLGVYEPRGDLQLIVEGMRRAGQGALFEQFQRLKTQLASEGLFDSARKRALPLLPRGIGVVTSLGAAALHDVVSTLQRRVPHIPVVISAAPVQGAGAPQELIKALSNLYLLAQEGRGLEADFVYKSAHTAIDVIVLVRGGGSMEDLWAFNDEGLARAIAQTPVPIVCGVGHETDFTIADFVADVRAPTPTAAAELVSQPRDSWLGWVDSMQERLKNATDRRLDMQNQRLDAALARLGRPSSLAAQQRMTLADTAHRLKSSASLALTLKTHRLQQLQARVPELMQRAVQRQHDRMDRASVRMDLLDPALVLQRGYAWVSSADADAKPVTRARDLVLRHLPDTRQNAHKKRAAYSGPFCGAENAAFTSRRFAAPPCKRAWE